MPARVKEVSVLYDMPVDTILLGASPPGLGHCFSASTVNYFQQRLSPHRGLNMGLGKKGDVLNVIQMQRDRKGMPLRSCIKPPPANCSSPIAIKEHVRNWTDTVPSTSSTSPKFGVGMRGSPSIYRKNGLNHRNGAGDGRKKKVLFADACGLSLETVKYMDGPSDMPPKLRIHLLQEVIQNEEAKPTHPYTYVPDFEQPASNYLDFRDRLEKDTVCLENVLIKDNITVVGTVKVKNIAFEKSVIVRVTFDEWKTHKDIEASFVFPSQTCSSRDKYDTFSFTVDMPPNLSGRNFEFCICYTTNHQSFWDNNHGNNYKIITEKEKEFVKDEERVSFQSLNGNHSWGQFSYWQAGQDERPYW